MLTAIIWEIRHFLFLVVLILLAFTSCFQILLANHKNSANKTLASATNVTTAAAEEEETSWRFSYDYYLPVMFKVNAKHNFNSLFHRTTSSFGLLF